MKEKSKIAVITGVTGQDGAYLSKLLLSKDYKVVGLIRSYTSANTNRLAYLGVLDQVILYECDLQDLSHVIKMLSEVKPTEIYNLAAQSSVSLSFQQPIGTIQFNINSVLNILEAIRLINPTIKFYQASSSEMCGKIEELPITEDTKFNPLSPYAISKVAAHYIAINYRDSYNIFACCGILFNHESYLRGENFFVKKVIRGALDILHGKKEFIEVGNLLLKRDFGFSEKYVEAMWLMLQHTEADDYMVCSGQSIYLKDIVEYVFNSLAIPLNKVKVNEHLFRPTDIEDIYGSSEKAKKVLHWNYDIDFFEGLTAMLREEEQNYVV